MRYWLTYFWTLCFTPSPHNLPFLHSDPFFQPSLPDPFIFFFLRFSPSAHRFPQSGGQVRGHLARPRRRAWSTWQQRPLLLEICRSVPNFHLHPLPSCLCVKKTPAGMLQWGAVSAQSSEAAKFGCCHEESHTGNSSAREKVGNKRRWRTSASARGQRPLWSPHHRTMSGLVWLSGYILWKRLIVEPFFIGSKTDFQSTNKKKKA